MVGGGSTAGNGLNVSLDLNILTLVASRGDEESDSNRPLEFRVDAKLEEKSRRSGEVTLAFELAIGAKPAVAKFDIKGQVIVRGESKDIERIIAMNPNTQVPILISEIYSRTYSMIYILASGIKVPYPAAGLLYSENGLQAEDININQASAKPSEKEPVQGVTRAG